MKVCVLGCGYWGSNLIRDFYNLDVLSCICDTNADFLQKHKERYNVDTYTDFDEALQHCDSVVIALPAMLHHKFAKQALLNNKDVFVEKPITLDISEAEELIKISKERNKILMVGHIMLYNPAISKIKEYIHKIGNIRYIKSNRLGLGKIRKDGNVLWSFSPHDLSIIVNILNIVDVDKVTVDNVQMTKITNGDICNITMKYNDINIDINLSWLSPYKEHKLIITGDRGSILFDDINKRLTIMELEDANIENKKQYDIEFSKELPLTLECKHFIDCCISRIEPLSSGLDGLNIIKLIHRCDKQDNIFIHPTSTVDNGAIIGNNTKIWHYSHICSGAIIGQNCSIGQNCYIDSVKLGDNCKLQNNVSLYKGLEIGNNVFFGPSCVFTNDKIPRCKYPKNGKYIKTIIEDDVSIGANATIICGIKLGKGCLIGSGSVVTKDVEPYTIVFGNPSTKYKNIDDYGNIIE